MGLQVIMGIFIAHQENGVMLVQRHRQIVMRVLLDIIAAVLIKLNVRLVVIVQQVRHH